MDRTGGAFFHFVKKYIWPIEKHELRKFLPMSALMFSILFNQNILRILKDSILIAEVSAEVTSFAKVYCVAPSAALFVIIYAKMLNSLSFNKIFNYLIVFFNIYFIVFAFVIYPNIDVFHMDGEKLARLMELYPNVKWQISLLGNWSYIIYYVLAELWPNIFYVLLFWQFANEISDTNEAKRFYTLFSLIGNSSLIFVGILIAKISHGDNFILKYLSSDNKLALIQASSILIVLMSGISVKMLNFLCNTIMVDPAFYPKAKAERPVKIKLGLVDSFKYILSSKYLWLMLITSAAFGLSMNLVEAVWKAKIKELYPTLNEFAEFNSLYIFWTGIVIMIFTIIGNNIIRSFDWFISAVITPIIIMVTGLLFFLLVVFEAQFHVLFNSIITITPLALAVIIGAIQNVIAKGAKYSIWDTSREMLYIPLDEELKTKGKAAVDIVSSKIGKSSSGLVQSMLFMIYPSATYSSIAPFMMIIFALTCVVWIRAVKHISVEYKKIV